MAKSNNFTLVSTVNLYVADVTTFVRLYNSNPWKVLDFWVLFSLIKVPKYNANEKAGANLGSYALIYINWIK